MTSHPAATAPGLVDGMLVFKRTTLSARARFDEARFNFVCELCRLTSSSLNCLRSVLPPIPIMTVLPRNELVSLSDQSTAAPTSGGSGPMEERPSEGIGERSQESVNGIGQSFSSTSCDHAHAPTQPEQFRQGNRPTNEYVLVSETGRKDFLFVML
jgi:hypothetical protein